jgi:hypothetical protein
VRGGKGGGKGEGGWGWEVGAVRGVWGGEARGWVQGLGFKV